MLDAAETLNARLLPFRPAAGGAGEGAWEATVKAATDAGDSLVGGAAGVEGKAPAGKGEGVSRRVPRGERLVRRGRARGGAQVRLRNLGRGVLRGGERDPPPVTQCRVVLSSAD